MTVIGAEIDAILRRSSWMREAYHQDAGFHATVYAARQARSNIEALELLLEGCANQGRTAQALRDELANRLATEPLPLIGIRCVDCGDEFRRVPRDVVDDGPPMCRICWYSGAHLASNMVTVIAGLEEATGGRWVAEHTGGGCFWLATYLDPAEPETADQEKRMVVVTQFPDVLSGNSTLDEVEKTGWLVGVYRTYEDMVACFPEDCRDVEYGLTTEQLFAAAREGVRVLTEGASA